MHLDISNMLTAGLFISVFCGFIVVMFATIALSLASGPLVARILGIAGLWLVVAATIITLGISAKAQQDTNTVALQHEAARVYGLHLTQDQALTLAANVGWEDSDPGSGGTIAYDQGQEHLRITLDQDTRGIFRIYSNGKELPELNQAA